jgi:chemosensory pili system protein ChpA (sensor histidine kinase/response regulator)
MLDEISRAAQEKLVVAQVTQEIQANLNQVEEVLDRFFRDASDRAGLPMLPNLMKQILGALNILQFDVAAIWSAKRSSGSNTSALRRKFLASPTTSRRKI